MEMDGQALMYYNILAVDPGKTTGWAYYRYDMGLADYGEYDFEQFVRWVDRNKADLDTVVCERYIITGATAVKSQQPEALQVIGFLRGISITEDSSFILQMPNDAKRFATDERLDEVGWLFPGGKGHSRDAARHLLLYLAKEGLYVPEV